MLKIFRSKRQKQDVIKEDQQICKITDIIIEKNLNEQIKSRIDPSGKRINCNTDLKKLARLKHRETKKGSMYKID